MVSVCGEGANMAEVRFKRFIVTASLCLCLHSHSNVLETSDKDLPQEVALTSSKYWWATAAFVSADWPAITWKVTSNLKLRLVDGRPFFFFFLGMYLRNMFA